MEDNQASANLDFKSIMVTNVKRINDFLYITLENGQKIISDSKVIYDVSNYYELNDIFYMEDKLCAVFDHCVVVLSTMDVILNEPMSYNISKHDERILYVIMSSGTSKMFDIKNRRYLPIPNGYEFEHDLANNMYVFCEKASKKTNFYDYKRCVIDADGKTINVDGWIETQNSNYLIIKKKDCLIINKINEDKTTKTNILKKENGIIAKPEYFNGEVIIMEKGIIKFMSLDLELLDEVIVPELELVYDYEIIPGVLKLCITNKHTGLNKHIFVNLDNKKVISNKLIEGYPYWTPKVYLGRDDVFEIPRYFEQDKTYPTTTYHFYNSNFDELCSVVGTTCNEYNEDTTFIVKSWDGENEQQKFVNGQTGTVKDFKYRQTELPAKEKYGYGFNRETNLVDIIDQDLNVIIPNIDFDKLGLNDHHNIYGSLEYFVVNNYACLIQHRPFGHRSYFRYILLNPNGEVLLDSSKQKCLPMGDYIKIMDDEHSEFLNTLTGEIGELYIEAKTNENNKILFDKNEGISNKIKMSNDDEQKKELLPLKPF